MQDEIRQRRAERAHWDAIFEQRRARRRRFVGIMGVVVALLFCPLLRPNAWATILVGIGAMALARRIAIHDLTSVGATIVYGGGLAFLSTVLHSVGWMQLTSKEPFGNYFVFVWLIYVVVGAVLGVISEQDRTRDLL